MSLERHDMPERNQLPLDIQDSRQLAQSGESDVWRAEIKDSNSQDRKIALKQNRQEAFASDEEMQRSKKFYDYLKSSPEFGKFVPDTLYFKARMAEGEPVRSYCIQELLSGKTINRLSDAELYKDPEVKQQLLEFIDATVAILRATRKEWKVKPDFGKSPDDDENGTLMANVKLNPRYSNNILITDAPDENGRRVFFIDTGENLDERTKMLWRVFQREVIGRIQESRFEEWKKELQRFPLL
jgi:hypothetical protein